MSLLEQLIGRINELESRLARLETSEYVGKAGDADTVDGFHAAATATANKLLALDSNARLGSEVAVGSTTGISGLYRGGIRAAANNTYYDILQFTAGSGVSGKVATVSGLLTITALVYATSGYYQMRSRLLFVSLRKMTTYAMQSTIQQLGSDNVIEYASKATTLTVQEKSGATATNLIIQAKVTCADYNTGSLFYTFIAGSGAMHVDQMISVNVLSD